MILNVYFSVLAGRKQDCLILMNINSQMHSILRCWMDSKSKKGEIFIGFKIHEN